MLNSPNMASPTNPPTLSEITQIAEIAHKKGETITLVTGVFDILHKEHETFLQKAKSTSDILIVGLESDHRVTQIKGPGRPVNQQLVRRQNLGALNIADHIFILPENFSSPRDHEKLISSLKPNILAVSSHSPHQDKKHAILAKYGGKVQVVHQHNSAISSTKIIQNNHLNAQKP